EVALDVNRDDVVDAGKLPDFRNRLVEQRLGVAFGCVSLHAEVLDAEMPWIAGQRQLERPGDPLEETLRSVEWCVRPGHASSLAQRGEDAVPDVERAVAFFEMALSAIAFAQRQMPHERQRDRIADAVFVESEQLGAADRRRDAFRGIGPAGAGASGPRAGPGR